MEDVTATAPGASLIGSADVDLARIIERETNDTYRTPGERAAYRAGMSTAAMICDAYAKLVPNKKHAYVATACGDAIWRFRKLISVPSLQRGALA